MSINKKADNSDVEKSANRVTVEISDAFLKHQSSLRRYIGRFIHQTQDIEDIVHETFLNSYSAAIKTRIKYPQAFLFKTAKNLALKHLDKCANRLVDHVGDLEDMGVLIDKNGAEGSDYLETQEQFASFCRAVNTLPVQCRKTFILRKVYGFSHKQVAEQLEISVSTVEKHLAKGILRCNEYMHSRGLGYHPEATAGRSRNR